MKIDVIVTDMDEKKKEAIQNYIDYICNTPEFQEELKKSMDEYFNGAWRKKI